MKPTIIEEKIFEYEPFEEDGSVLMSAESSWRGMADELQELHYLRGAQFISQLKLIIYYGEFHPVEGDTNIFSAISENSDDFANLINAARKAVEHGYRVYILPNPRSCRTADFIFDLLTDYNSRLLASDIKTYFESNRDAIEVLIFKGNKMITVKRGLACNPSFNRIFRKLYEK